jgi:hypothetical protein
MPVPHGLCLTSCLPCPPPQVRAAYSSGNPALGVGAGNTPAVIDETADIQMAVSSILVSKVVTFAAWVHDVGLLGSLTRAHSCVHSAMLLPADRWPTLLPNCSTWRRRSTTA